VYVVYFARKFRVGNDFNLKENKTCCKLMRMRCTLYIYINKFLDVLGIGHLVIHLSLRGE
jgi:hypothetical protein